MSRTPHLLAVAAAAVVAAGVVTSGARAAGLDPAIYDPGVAAGQVEHGVMSFTITGSPMPEDRRIEYWVGADRWREQTTDAKTGELISGRVHDASGTTWLQYKPVNGDPKVVHFSGDDSVPGPGFPAPFNTKLVTTGVAEGSATHPQLVTLQALGAQAVAGFPGTRYEVLTNGQAGIGAPGEPGHDGSHSILVLQDGTDQPLLRESTGPNGGFGTFDQREELLSRETTPAARASVRLTKDAFARTVKGWRVKAKAAAAKKQAKAKKHHNR
jgi:hypothetical protein